MMNLRASFGACFFNLRRCLEIKELQINEEIRDKEVRLVDEKGNQIGIINTNQANDMAASKKLYLLKSLDFHLILKTMIYKQKQSKVLGS